MLIRERMPQLADVRGHGKVELFDERTARKLLEVPFENFISFRMKDRAKWRVRTALNDAASSQDYLNAYPDYGYFVGERMRANHGDGELTAMLQDLTCWPDETAPVPATDEILRGRVTAWAAKDFYVGTDTRRGGMNQAECAFSPTYAKWVADWPTHAGNGTFASVGWAHLEEGNAVPYCRGIGSGILAPKASFAYYKGYNPSASFSPAGELWYSAANESNNTSWAVYKGLTPVAPQCMVAYPYLCWSPDGTLWATNWNGTIKRIDPASGAVLSSTTYPGGPTSGQGWQNQFHMVSDTVMYMRGNYVSGSSPHNYRLFRMELVGAAWTVVSEAPLGGYGSTSDQPFSVTPSGDILEKSGDWLWKYSPVDGTTRWMSRGWQSWYSDNKPVEIPGTEEIFIIGAAPYWDPYFSQGSWWRGKPSGIATRVALGAPVTKTNLQTMKITYQFDFA